MVVSLLNFPLKMGRSNLFEESACHFWVLRKPIRNHVSESSYHFFSCRGLGGTSKQIWKAGAWVVCRSGKEQDVDVCFVWNVILVANQDFVWMKRTLKYIVNYHAVFWLSWDVHRYWKMHLKLYQHLNPNPTSGALDWLHQSMRSSPVMTNVKCIVVDDEASWVSHCWFFFRFLQVKIPFLQIPPMLIFHPLWVSHISGPLKMDVNFATEGGMYRTWCHLWWTRGHPWRFGFFQRKQQMKWWQVSHLHILGGFIFLGEKFLLSTRAEMIQFWLLRISDGWLKPPTSITWIFAWLHGRKHWTKSGPHCHPLGLKWWESTSFWDTGGHIARSLSYEDPYWHTQ